MELITLICLCLISAVCGRYSNIHPSVRIGWETKIGDHANIESGCVIGNGVLIGTYCNMGPSNNIHDAVRIGHHCTFRLANRIHNNVLISDYVTLNTNNEIGHNCEMKHHVRIDSNCKIGSNAMLFEYAYLCDNVYIRNGSIVDPHSKICENTIAGENTYFGSHSNVGPRATIGENAVIHRHANIPNGNTVAKGEVIIRTPTSAALYAYCTPLDQILPNEAEIMDKNSQQSISAEANEVLRQKLIDQIHQLSSNCANPDFSNDSSIKSLYLILYHGIVNFKKYSRGSDKDVLAKELHFGSRATRNVLTPEVTELMVRMLALEEDHQRPNRVSGDSFCKMSQEIKNKQRNVRVDQ